MKWPASLPNLKRLVVSSQTGHAVNMIMKPDKEFLSFYDRHYLRVGKFVASIVKNDSLADDLTQETFIRAHKSIGELKDPTKEVPWLFKIAYHLCIDYFRFAKKPSENTTHLTEEMTLSNRCMVEKELERHQMSTCVQNQILLLPKKYRSVLFLSDVFEFTNKEIAETLSLSLENVKVRLHRGRKQLKSILEKNCTFEQDDRNVLICEPKKVI